MGVTLSATKKLLVNRITRPVLSKTYKLLGRAIEKKTSPGESNFRAMVLRERERVRELREDRSIMMKQLDQAKSGELLLDLVNTGMDFDRAIVQFVRECHAYGNRMKARSFTHSLMENDKYSALGHIGFGVFLVNEELYESAHSYFLRAGATLSKDLCPVEYYLAFFAADQIKAGEDLANYLDGNREKISREAYLDLIKALVKYMKVDAVVTELPHIQKLEGISTELDDAGTQLVQWLATHTSNIEVLAEPLATGEISLAVMDYKLLDRSRTSSNRGDYVQTLAALSNICRFTDVEFVGDSELSNLLTDLKSDIKPERKISGVAAKVRPVALDRDYASGRNYPANTWLVCNGWFMHTNFRGEMDFPFPEEVNPIFLSFHVNNPDVLTHEVAENLKKYEPIGCRDWTTVYRLHDYGVEAFFSGCLTTTVGQVLPSADADSKKMLAVVETQYIPEKYKGWKVEEFCQVGDYVRDFSLVEGIKDAKDMLELYAPFTKVTTSRLHCYLPCRSMGLEVEFKPRNFSDVRFEGLLDLDAIAFNKIRNGIEYKLEKMLGAIFAGQNRDEVMSLWKSLCATEVAFAENYRTTFPAAPGSSVDVSQVLQDIKHQVVSFPSASGRVNSTKLAFALDQNLKDQLAIVLQSIVDNMKEPADVHVLCRGLDQAYYQQLHDFFPEFNFFFYNFDLIDYGDNLRMLSHTTVSTMDRLFLPELLADIDKVLYLDVDILVRADITELFNLELGDNVLAGKRTKLKTWRNLVRLITRASLHLTPQNAWELRRRLHATVDMTRGTFNAGVLLLNLRLMRAEEFTANHLYLIEFCAFNDQDALNVYGGARVLELDAAWNHVPNQDECEEPKIIHWAGPNKPWKKMYVWGVPQYNAIRDRLFPQ